MGKGSSKKQKPTATETASQEISYKNWLDFKRDILPNEIKNAQMVMDRERGKGRAVTRVGAGAGQATADAVNNIGRNVAARGINPNSGAATSEVQDLTDRAAEAGGEAEINAVQNLESNRRRFGTGIAATAREVEGQTVTGLENLSSIEANKQRILQEVESNEKAGYGRAAGQAAGLYLAAR